MNFFKGLSTGTALLIEVLPVLVITALVAAALAFVFGPRTVPPKGRTPEGDLPWYRVHDYQRVFATIFAMAAFGAFQGYLVGSINSAEADKTIASLVAGAVTFLSTIVGLFYSKDAPESFKQSIAPGVVAFLLCFLTFSGYRDRLLDRPLEGATAMTPEPGASAPK